MTDIVKRLRILASVDNCQASIEAADEIERLRAALEEIASLGAQKRGSASYAMAAIARAALTAQPAEGEKA